MGRGNVCVNGVAEGLYFVDNDFLDVYSNENEYGEIKYCSLREADDGFEYCECESYFRRKDFEILLVEEMICRFPSFEFVDRWISRSRKAILENKLFYVVLEDNEWSMAVELIQKEDEYGSGAMIGLQMGLYREYLEGIKEILLDMNGEVGIYTGAWTSGVIRKDG